MTLKVIEPNMPGYDERTYECPECKWKDKILVRSH